MKSESFAIIALSLLGKSLAQIVTEGVASFASISSCADVIATHTFQGTCCSVSDSSFGGCQLQVVGGTCEPDGPIWFLSILSTSSDSCPESQYQVLPTDPPVMGGPPTPLSTTPSMLPAPGLTSSPTLAPTPSPIPAITADPTFAPTTSSPTAAPVTITSSPSAAPDTITSSPSAGPGIMTSSPSTSPGTTTANPTMAATTGAPTTSPITASPTMAATTGAPSTSPMTNSPTSPPTSSPITEPPTTEAPTATPGPCQNDNDCPVCQFDCAPEFCGVDGNCYIFTCQNFFRYHRETEYDGTGDTELVCQDLETDIHVSNYGCDIAIGTLATPPSVGMKPNQACFGNSKFGEDVVSVECYDLSDMTADEDYDDYEADAGAASITCENAGPFFFYSSAYSLEDVRTSFSITDTVVSASATASIDKRKVGESMYAVIFKDLVSNQPSDAPTGVPSSTPIFSSASPSTMEPSTGPPVPTSPPTANVTEAPGCQSNDECPQQFCGTDGNCYDYTCQDFFRYHPTTEYDGLGDTELTCVASTTAIDIMNYGCTKTVGRTTTDGGLGMPSNQKCIGTSRNAEFLVTVECFNLADNTDFTEYRTTAPQLDLTCGGPGEVPEARFFYGVGYTKSEFVDGRLQSNTVTENGALRSESFIEENAFKSMFAVIVREPFTPAPTDFPTERPSESPTMQDLSAAVSYSKVWTATASMMMGLLLLIL